MPDSLELLLGQRERFRLAPPGSWRLVEDWIGRKLPVDYKALVDGYGDGILWKHLFVPHPEGVDPLLKFMQEEQRDFHAAYENVRNIPTEIRESWDRVVPWAYHDWNGDVCLLVPGAGPDQWDIAVAFRQCPEFMWVEGGVTGFLRLLVEESRFPRGWPVTDLQWQSMPDSPLV
ncbi:hypothetical protein [Streptomyces sp. DSM 40750]|uniref:hypothetical protein n=1 Tax=Streptomyces sp. DSM 40750 TaxID=2801030 RepID=UPI00214AD1D9|nr:hypothetical protein [Streptomyces sp. DSM 40750]UUU25526.1 hypothetical protein JIX55_37695 [Streptomyces sp. DSM 40750]